MFMFGSGTLFGVLGAAMFSFLVVVETWLSIPIAGSLWLLMLGMTLQLFASASFGIFLASIAGSMPQFGLLLVLVLFPLQILAGGTTPIENMPPVLRWFMQATPDAHFVSLAQSILFRGAGMETVWPRLAGLMAIGLALFSFSLWRFRKTLR